MGLSKQGAWIPDRFIPSFTCYFSSNQVSLGDALLPYPVPSPERMSKRLAPPAEADIHDQGLSKAGCEPCENEVLLELWDHSSQGILDTSTGPSSHKHAARPLRRGRSKIHSQLWAYLPESSEERKEG